MDHILYSVTTEHDPRWLLAAALICILGMATAMHLLAAARLQAGHRRRNRVLLAALISGLAVFTTHFVALQGYLPGQEIRYALWPTIGSFLLALGSFNIAAVTVMLRPSPLFRGGAALIALGGVSGMHFLGIYGLRLAGAVSWDPVLAAFAIAAGAALALTAGGLCLCLLQI